jgi:hypothetical protein
MLAWVYKEADTNTGLIVEEIFYGGTKDKEGELAGNSAGMTPVEERRRKD